MLDRLSHVSAHIPDIKPTIDINQHVSTLNIKNSIKEIETKEISVNRDIVIKLTMVNKSPWVMDARA